MLGWDFFVGWFGDGGIGGGWFVVCFFVCWGCGMLVGVGVFGVWFVVVGV